MAYEQREYGGQGGGGGGGAGGLEGAAFVRGRGRRKLRAMVHFSKKRVGKDHPVKQGFKQDGCWRRHAYFILRICMMQLRFCST